MTMFEMDKPQRILLSEVILLLLLGGAFYLYRTGNLSISFFGKKKGQEFRLWEVGIAGAVINPGVYSVSPGSALRDLIKKSGGYAGSADRDLLNADYRLKNREVLFIPWKDKEEEVKGVGWGKVPGRRYVSGSGR
ncbi:MAG TPA: SLBB domain-containing protein [bacterium]|nr:SLBB domain-containing protein [bacterium]